MNSLFPLSSKILENWLILIGYDPKVVQSQSPIGKACESGNVVSLVKILSKQREIVDDFIVPGIPLTPLFVACMRNRSSIVDLLLYRYGASLSLSGPPAATDSTLQPNCIHIVCSTGNAALLRKLLLHLVIDDVTIGISQSEKRTPLFEVDPFGNDFLHPFILGCMSAYPRVVAALTEFYETWTSVDLCKVRFLNLNVVQAACLSLNENMLKCIVEKERFADLINEDCSVETAASGDSFRNMWCRIVEKISASCEDDALKQKFKTLAMHFEKISTPLSLCVRLQWAKGVKVLIEHGANVIDACGPEGCTSVHVAAAMGSYEVLHTLLNHMEKVANLESLRVFLANETPLHVAVRNNHIQSSEFLLDCFPRWANVPDLRSNLPLHYACLSKNYAIFNSLVDRTKNGHSISGENGYTALHFLCLPNEHPCSKVGQSELTSMMEKLLLRGAELSTRDKQDGCSVLHLALEFCAFPFFDNLLTSAQPSDLEVADFDGKTLLHYAVELDNTEAVNKLLLLGVNVDAIDINGQTALHMAKTVRMCALLCEYGAQLNLQDCDGMAPLHLSIVGGNQDVLDFFLNRSDLSLVTNSGRSILHLACDKSPNSVAIETISKVIHHMGEHDVALDVCGCGIESGDCSLWPLNFCIRSDDDELSLKVMKLLVQHRLTQCNLEDALINTVRFDLMNSCLFLMAFFRSSLTCDLFKQMAFCAIAEAKLRLVKFFLDNQSITQLDICQVKLATPFSCSALLYPIEMCICAAVLTSNDPRDKTDQLVKVFDYLVPFYSCIDSKVYRFDFLSSQALQLTCLRSACCSQKAFHMLSQWFSLNDVNPLPVVSKLEVCSKPASNQNSLVSSLAKTEVGVLSESFMFIVSVRLCCRSCSNYWNSFKFDLWKSLISSANGTEANEEHPKQSTVAELALLLALDMVTLTSRDFVEALDANSNGLNFCSSQETPPNLKDLSACKVRNGFFSRTEILKLKLSDKLPSYLSKLVAQSFASLDDNSKALLEQSADLLVNRSENCSL